jgi:hypothetical protein
LQCISRLQSRGHFIKVQAKTSAKKPQLLQQQANVVVRTTQHRMLGIAQGTLERISAQFAIHLHVPVMCPRVGSMALRRLIIALRVRVTPI